jgi:dolichol-phosphate mannosyltransferase
MFASAGAYELSVVVPTRNERDNIAPLLKRLERVRPELRLEVVFVDDSTDDTPRVISEHAARSSREVLLIHRAKNEQTGGLGGAVQAGLIAARSDLVCVMDADLQHPPELIGALYDEAARSNGDIVVASRYCSLGDIGELSGFRLAVSRTSTTAAKLLFPRHLRRISDPMSGFFLIRRSTIEVKALQPKGFKILLEIVLAGKCLRNREVPLRFGERRAGVS